jgi:hypothetical protein
MKHSKKSEIWISATLYALIMVVTLVIVVSAVVPLITKMKDRAVFQKVKTEMTSLDEQISNVASEGAGSQRTVPIEVQEGMLKVSNGELYWELNSEAKLLEPRTSLRMGNVFFSSNADVNASVSGNTATLKNSRIEVKFDMAASDINNMITQMKIGSASLSGLPGGITFKLDGNSFPSITSAELVPGQGINFGRATIVAHTSNASVDIEFTLEGGADFLTTNVDVN